MVKPTDSMEWATDGAAQIAEPLEAKKDIGWLTGEKPPAQYFNWWMNNAYLWQQYFEVTTDTLLAGSNILTSTTNITLTIDSDNNSTSNYVVIDHNGTGAELFKFDETSNLLVNTATVGASGVGVLAMKNGTAPSANVADVVQLYPADVTAGDSRLFLRSEQGGTLSLGNNTINNANSDGTLTIASEKHVTIDIDSDNDGTDGIFKVRANGTTDALSLTEAGVLTTSNVTATNSSDITALKVAGILSSLNPLYVSTSAQTIALTGDCSQSRMIGARGAGANTGYLWFGSTTQTGPIHADTGASFEMYPALGWSARGGVVPAGGAVDFDGVYSVNVGAAGAIYTSPDPWTTYTSRTSGTANGLGSVATGNSFWVACGNGNNNTIRYNTSDPTTAWSASTSGLDGTTNFLGVDFGGGLFCAVTNDDEIIYTANPASGWTQATGPFTMANKTSIKYAGDRFYIYGQTGTLLTSTNASTWSTITNADFGDIHGIVAIPLTASTYLYLMKNNTSFRYSTNGTTWTTFVSGVMHNMSGAIGNNTGRFFFYEPTSGYLFGINSANDLFWCSVPKYT